MDFGFIEKNILVKGKFDLEATIAIPQDAGNRLPAIIFVSGTGVADRDGNIPKQKFNMNIYKNLSDFFAKMGFVTLRYDKRGVGKSGGSHLETSLFDLVDDLISNVEYLEQQEFVDKNKIIVCGHSEGCIVTTIANQRHPATGLILIAGAGMSLYSALKYQNYLVLQEIINMKGFKGWFYRKFINQNNYLNNVNKMFKRACGTEKDIIKLQGMKIPAKWTREHAQYTDKILTDAIVDAGCPILAITGDKDVQAPPSDIARLAMLHQDKITAILIHNMSHILRGFGGEFDMLTLSKQYKKDLEKPLHPMLLEELKHWVTYNFMK